MAMLNALGQSTTRMYSKIVKELPTWGISNVLYLLDNGSDGYVQYIWKNMRWVAISSSSVDMTSYATKEYSDEKDKEVLKDAKTYVDNKEFTQDELGGTETTEGDAQSLFDSVFNISEDK